MPCCTCSRSPTRRGSTLTLDDFTRIGDRTPVLADLRPSGRYMMSELVRNRRHPAADEDLARRGLVARRLPHGHRHDARREPRRRRAVPAGPGHRPQPRRSVQGRQPPRRSSTAISRPKARSRRSPARRARASPAARASFDCEEEALRAILDGVVAAGDVLVIRYEGPKGGPGMREMLSPTGAIIGRGSATKSR